MDAERHDQAMRIFLAARKLAGGERDRYLTENCGGDGALRAEIESLLTAEAPTHVPFLESPVLGADFRLRQTIPADAGPGGLPEAVPARIGPYRLLQRIGEGGFGSVYMAEQEEPVRRRVALKIIKLGMDTRSVIARFEAERQALAMMDHHSIAKVFDAGATESGRPYFVMELCKGAAIVEYCDKNNLSVHDRLELFAQVCAAVQHAHTKGIIHRDIKPSNVLVSTLDERPQVKVIDFGIAKATAATLTERTLFTEHGQLIGTPEYMSPEQAEGSLDIDTRTDVYSLGVLLYELLTGTTPFNSKDLRSAAYAEIQRIIREVDPPKPSTRLSQNTDTIASVAARRRTEPKRLGSLVRGELDWIVMKALEKDRQRRYETANGLAMDVRRYLAGEPVLAAPPSRPYLVRKFIRRHRMVVTAGSLVAAALVLGVIGTTGGMLWALDEKSRAASAARAETIAKRKAQDNAAAALRAADEAERAAYQAQMLSAAHAVEDQRMDAATALLAATVPRLRGWEYQHLTSRFDRSLKSPFPSSWKIRRVNCAVDSGTTAVLRADGASESPAASGWVVCGADLGEERFILPDTDGGALWLSPDGSRAVWTPSNSGDSRPVRLWEFPPAGSVAAAPEVTPILLGDPPPRAPSARDGWFATWSPTGDRFILSREDCFEVREGRTGALLSRRGAEGVVGFTGHRGPQELVAMRGRIGADDAPSSLPAFDARALRLLDAHTFEPPPGGGDFRFDTPAIGSCFRQSRVACSAQDGTLRILDIEDGVLRPRFRVAPGMGVLTPPVLSADGGMVAVGTRYGWVSVWDASGPAAPAAPVAEFRSAGAVEVTGLMFLPDSGDLWACDAEGGHRVWPIRDAGAGVLHHRSFVYPVVVSNDGSMILSGGWDGHSGYEGGLKVWDARTGTLVAEHGRPNEIVSSAALSPDGRYAVVGYWSNSAALRRTEVMDLWCGRVVTAFRPGAGEFRGVVHPDGRRVIGVYSSGTAYVWELLSGRVLWQSEDRSIAAALSPDGNVLALAERGREVRLLDANSYAFIRRWEAHADIVGSLSFSSDGTRLLSTHRGDTVGVWDVATGAPVGRLVGHNTGIMCAAMSPDGTRIATGGRDRYVRLWDTTHFENVAQLGGHGDYVYSLAWSPDGRQLISGSGDSTVRIWDTRTLAEQVDAIRERSDAMPGIEAAFARALATAESPAAALEAVLASPRLTARERELARQAAARSAMKPAD